MFNKKFDVSQIYGGALGRMEDEYNNLVKEFRDKTAAIKDSNKYTKEYQTKQIDSLRSKYIDKMNSLKSKYNDEIMSNIDEHISAEKEKQQMKESNPLKAKLNAKIDAVKSTNWIDDNEINTLLLYKLWQSIETSNKLTTMPHQIKAMNAEELNKLYAENSDNPSIKALIENEVNNKIKEADNTKELGDTLELSHFKTLHDEIINEKTNTPLKQLETAKSQLQIRFNDNSYVPGHLLNHDIKQDLGYYEAQKAKYFDGSADNGDSLVEKYEKGISSGGSDEQEKHYEAIKNIVSNAQQDSSEN